MLKVTNAVIDLKFSDAEARQYSEGSPNDRLFDATQLKGLNAADYDFDLDCCHETFVVVDGKNGSVLALILTGKLVVTWSLFG